jgi:periplasmic divalent cation tolerance protein
MPEETLLVLSTFPDAERARAVANAVVSERLAACANLVPQVESIYRWQGKVETSQEVLVIFKTTHGRYQQLEERLRALHPYEVPEIISVQILGGSFAYLNWVVESCATS